MKIGNRNYALDDEGYLQATSRHMWKPQFAEDYAKVLGIHMTRLHWEVLNWTREYYLKSTMTPLVAQACREFGIPLASMIEMWRKFPMRQVCKLAGLERPVGCV